MLQKLRDVTPTLRWLTADWRAYRIVWHQEDLESDGDLQTRRNSNFRIHQEPSSRHRAGHRSARTSDAVGQQHRGGSWFAQRGPGEDGYCHGTRDAGWQLERSRRTDQVQRGPHPNRACDFFQYGGALVGRARMRRR